MKNKLPKQNINFSEWYTQIVKKAGLADYGPVKGNGHKTIWVSVMGKYKRFFDSMIKKTGMLMHIFLFIPKSF